LQEANHRLTTLDAQKREIDRSLSKIDSDKRRAENEERNARSRMVQIDNRVGELHDQISQQVPTNIAAMEEKKLVCEEAGSILQT